MLTYFQSIQLLFQLERLGMKFGLAGITRLLRELDNPHKKFPSVHVAGTNGKGSTASMLASILTAAGFRTGLYTSPHLISFEERIRINGKPISRQMVTELTSRIRPSLKKYQPTFFEATTAMAFSYFAEKEVDIAVVEAGLGGRLDSTNVIRPLASVITNISLEHTEILGDTLEKIAYEKAGIVKKGIPCVTGIRDSRALAVVSKVCKSKGSRLIIGTEYQVTVRKTAIDGTLLDFKEGDMNYRRLWVSLPGQYQLDNLALALAAIQSLVTRSKLDISEEAIRAGLAHVRELSGLSGRLLVVSDRPRVVVDVAHNVDAMRNLLDSLKRLKIRMPVIVFGVARDKDYSSMVRDLARVADQVVAVAARSSRSRPASDVAALFERENCRVRAALSVEEGMEVAVHLAGKDGTILVTGSHFVVGEAMIALGRKRA